MGLVTAIRDTYKGFKSLLIGMRITGREAARPIITVQYPHETLKMPARFRGHIKLVLDPETGRPRCTACTICAKSCPSGCIVLDGVRREGDKKKSVSKYDLDFTKCSLCGSCIESCPSDAIEFSKEYNVVSLDRNQFAQMDLYAKVEAEAKAWAATHPTPPAAPAPAAPAAAPAAAPVTAPATAAAPATPVAAAPAVQEAPKS
jgi:NADH-quinone oxidoreductase subunit I